jgi:hypothetical protein
MFPTVEPSVISLILESVHGSQDRAIEQLLSMTDPEFRPDELAGSRVEEEVSQIPPYMVLRMYEGVARDMGGDM